MKKHVMGLAACILMVSLTGCGAAKTNMEHESDEALVVYCPHPIDFINPIVSEFENQTGILVKVETGGTGKLLLRAEERGEPLCDVLWGGSLSTTYPKRELFADYTSANEGMVRDEFKNEEGNMTRFTDIPSVLMINTNLTRIKIRGYRDLLNPDLKGRIAMCDPATSSSAYEHLINMLYACGEGDPEAGWGYVEEFCKNLDGELLKSSSEVYQGVAEGRYAVGLTFEEGGARYAAENRPVDLVYMEEGVVSTPDAVCIVKGCPHEEEARKFVDFVTGKDAQSMISKSLDRRSVRTDVKPPENLPAKEEIHMIYSDRELVSVNKEQWIARFEEIYRRVTPWAFTEDKSGVSAGSLESGAAARTGGRTAGSGGAASK